MLKAGHSKQRKRTLVVITDGACQYMNMTEIIKKAKSIGIDPGRMKKTELIRSIQTAEGCVPCFGSTDGECAHTECCFAQDCFIVSLTENKQAAEHLGRQVGELTAANEGLRQEITERQEAERDMEQYCGCLEERIEEQDTELAAVREQLQRQIAECQRLEQCLIRLQIKLDNINSIANEQLGFRKTGSDVSGSLMFPLVSPGYAYN